MNGSVLKAKGVTNPVNLKSIKNEQTEYFENVYSHFPFSRKQLFFFEKFHSGAEFTEYWKNSLVEGNSSNINNKRIPSIIEKEHWYPLYVGKREDLNSRITEHLYKPCNVNTYALRLNERSKLLKHTEIRVYFQEVCLFNKEYQSEIQYILTSLESEIRKNKDPLTGKQ